MTFHLATKYIFQLPLNIFLFIDQKKKAKNLLLITSEQGLADSRFMQANTFIAVAILQIQRQMSVT
jgi:hypothetical protein